MTKTAPSCRCGSWYRDNELERVSGTHWTALARLTREFHPLRVSQVALFACDGSRPLWTASTLGLRLDNRISPICGSSPPGPPRPVCARMAALPIPPFSKWGHGLLIPARLSSRTHIDVPSGPIQLSNCRQPAHAPPAGGGGEEKKNHGNATPSTPGGTGRGPVPIGVGVESPLILMCILGSHHFPTSCFLCSLCLFFDKKWSEFCQNTVHSCR